MSQTATTSRRVTLITGGSGGIGADLARVFATNGHDLALVARDGGRLAAVSDEIAASGRPPPLCIVADLSTPAAYAEIRAALEAAGAQVVHLVNNAGFGLLGRACDLDLQTQLGIVDVNVRALTQLSLGFLPDLIAARGRILNVSSVAGFLPGPGMAVYYATKAFVTSFSAALHTELKDSGVSVTALCPGVTRTDFQRRAGMDKAALYAMPGMSSRSVAQAGYDAMMAGRRQLTPGVSNKLMVALLPFLPRGLLLTAVAHLQARRKAA